MCRILHPKHSGVAAWRLRSRDASSGGANLGIPAWLDLSSNGIPDRESGQCLVGSLTGAVASQKVTEAPKGSLSLDGNQAQSAMAQGSLTARHTSRAGTKVGHSDPTARCGMAVAQRIKVTPGITGLSGPRVHIDGPVWHLDVGSSHPGAGVGPKGWAVRPLKRYASWV